MANIALITTCLKGFTAFWALLTLAVSGAMIGKFNDYVGSYFRGSGFSQGNAVIASTVLDMIYFTAAVVMLFIRPESILISVMVDTIIIGFLFILTLGSVAALSDVAGAFKGCMGDKFCSLGNATLALGWILVFLILAILLLEVIVTLRGYGYSLDTWRTPFNELVTNGPGHNSSRGITNHAETGLGGPTTGMTGVSSGPQVVQRV